VPTSRYAIGVPTLRYKFVPALRYEIGVPTLRYHCVPTLRHEIDLKSKCANAHTHVCERHPQGAISGVLVACHCFGYCARNDAGDNANNWHVCLGLFWVVVNDKALNDLLAKIRPQFNHRMHSRPPPRCSSGLLQLHLRLWVRLASFMFVATRAGQKHLSQKEESAPAMHLQWSHTTHTCKHSIRRESIAT
jgi:hypothetical protein